MTESLLPEPIVESSAVASTLDVDTMIARLLSFKNNPGKQVHS